MYWGAQSWIDMKTNRIILKLIVKLTGSQCRELKIDVMCALCSVFLISTHAAAFKSNHIVFVTYTWLADVNASVAKCLYF